MTFGKEKISTADSTRKKLHKHGSTTKIINKLKKKKKEVQNKKITKFKMNLHKMQFLAQLLKSVGGVSMIRRHFTSDRGLWMNTVLKRMPYTNNGLVQSGGNRRNFDAWVGDKKDGYKPQKFVSNKQHVLDGFKMLTSEFKCWKEEVKERFLNDPVLLFRPGKF